MIRLLRRSTTALLAAALLASCGGGGGLGSTSQGSVRLVNATPDFASLDLYESTNRIVSATANGSASGYVDLDDETYTFNLATTGSTTFAANVNGSVQKRQHATVLAYTTGGALNAAYLTDEEGSPSSGTAKFRVFNAANTEAGAVDVYLVGAACSTLQTLSIAATASNVGTTVGTYVQVPAASGGTGYHLCVTATGDKSDVRLELPSFTLSDQQIVTFVVVKSTGGVLVNGLVINQQSTVVAAPNTFARLRLAASVGAANATSPVIVGATVGNVPLGNLSSPDVGSYALVPAGTINAAITVGGTAVAAPGLTANAGADLTLLVGATGTPVLIADDNIPSTSSSKPVKIRLVNGVANSGTVTLSVDGATVGSGAAPGAASATALVPSSSQTTRLTATSSTAQLYVSNGNTLAANHVYSVFLLGDASAGTTGVTGILRPDR